MHLKPFKIPDWQPKPDGGAVKIDGRVVLVERDACVAMLRFGRNARFDAHAAPFDCHVMCLEGEGFTRVGDAVAELRAGHSVYWPRDVLHQLYTEDSTMVTLMLEHHHQLNP